MNPLRALREEGQSVWLDNIHRSLLLSGGLEQLIREDGLRGVTSNPTIFEKAIAGSHDYDDSLKTLVEASPRTDARALYEALAVEDIVGAADILRPVYEESGGEDGYVSLEIPPELAHEAVLSVAEARRLWRKVGRPNLMIKVPATKEGTAVIETLIAEGLNVNVTLIFSVSQYEAAALAYTRGLEKCVRPEKTASVGSFFVSRIDTIVDQALDAIGTDEALSLRGTIGIASARRVYRRFQEIFGGARWKRLAERGARVQRPLWASTGTKNPAYSDVLYIEDLIGAQTVNTMPPGTLIAFRDHGKVRPSLKDETGGADRSLHKLAGLGIDLEHITENLQADGIAAFVASFSLLLSALESRKSSLIENSRIRQGLSIGEWQRRIESRLNSWRNIDFPRRLRAHDTSLWAGSPEPEIKNRLGWLDLPESMSEKADGIKEFAEEIAAEGFTRIVLLGTGGSSLAPEAFQKIFGNRLGYPALTVLDSTHPAAVLALEKELDYERTLFLVSSKSGTTTETLSFFRYFWEKARLALKTPGRHFISITDAGTALDQLSRERNFRRVFSPAFDVGGRYSALTEFGLVPAALIGMDIRGLLDRAWIFAEYDAFGVQEDQGSGFVLGAILGELGLAKDKLTILTSPGLRSFPDWVEQLVAESTGKNGKGIVPVVHEPSAPLSLYGRDRLFVEIILEGDEQREQQDFTAALEAAGHSVIRIRLKEPLDVGQEIFRWEVAVASAGAALSINPFDQPDVDLAKELARKVMKEAAAGNRSEDLANETSGDDPMTLRASLIEWLSLFKPGDYIGIQAFLAPFSETSRLLTELRSALLKRTGSATTFGFGPRFLHSTGQLHKGGPNNGLFLQIVDDAGLDVRVPETDYSFGLLIRAQSQGDFLALRQRGRRVLRINLKKDVQSGLMRLLDAIRP